MNQKLWMTGVAIVSMATMMVEPAEAAQPDLEQTIAIGESLRFDGKF